MTRLALPALIAGLALPSAGCSELSALAELLPTVRFVRLDVHEVDFDRVDTDFVFAVDNPNPLSIELARYDYALELAGVELVAGDEDEGFVLEAVGESELRLPAVVDYVDVYDAVTAETGSDVLPFRLDGNFGFDTTIDGFEEVTLPYAAEGQFPALREPEFALLDLRVEGTQGFPIPTAVNLALDLEVANDLGSPIQLSGMNWALELDGRAVADGLTDELGPVDGAATRVIELPIDLRVIDAGIALVELLLNGGEAEVAVGITLDVDTPFGMVPLTARASELIDIDPDN